MYYVSGEGPASTLDPKEVWTAGLSYETGPWTVGVVLIDSEWISFSSLDIPWRTEMIQVGGGYALGVGVDRGLDIQFIEMSTAHL